jgi:hypothetical protein
VEPWNSNYETPDIWIDRPPYGTYDYTDSSGNPVGNGDRPRPHDQNKFYGRVHCDGQADATNVRLTFYTVTPPGVGDNGNWAPLQTKTIPTVQKNTAQDTAVIWVPEVGEHTCLKIYAEPQAGEVNAGGNNFAQENVFNFEAPASSVPAPLRIPVAVRNPRKERTVALMSIRNVPAGYIVHFPHAWLWLEPLQERKQTLTVVRTKDYNYYLEVAKEKLPRARIAVDGFLPRQYEEEWPKKTHPASCFSPMGGILAEVTPKRKVTLTLWQDKEQAKETPYLVAMLGKTNPAMNAETVTVELEDPTGRRRVATAVTNATGNFGARFNLLVKPSLEAKPSREREEPLKGTYRAQAYIANSPNAAQATSNNVYIVV